MVHNRISVPRSTLVRFVRMTVILILTLKLKQMLDHGWPCRQPFIRRDAKGIFFIDNNNIFFISYSLYIGSRNGRVNLKSKT